MLLSLLVKLWLCPIMAVDSWSCSSQQVIRTASSQHFIQPQKGFQLHFRHNYSYILHHPCLHYFAHDTSPTLYLGEKIFISHDYFMSSVRPLTIPRTLVDEPAIVTAAIFIHTSKLVLVVNGKVFIYFYRTWSLWLESHGITNQVNRLTSYSCCFAQQDPACNKISNVVLAYKAGNLISESNIFYSEDGGYLFLPLKSRPLNDGILLGIYVFASSAQIGMLIKDTSGLNVAYFMYGDVESIETEAGTPFSAELLKGDIFESLLPTGMRAFIIMRTEKTIISSSNDGLTTDIVAVLPTASYSNETLPESVCFITSTYFEIAAITKSSLFYGNLDMMVQMVHLMDKDNSTTRDLCDTMLFESTGTLSIIHPFADNETQYYHFHKCTINIQARLMEVQPPLQSCPMEIFTGDFHNKMYYIDTKQILHFNATFVPKPGTGAYPYIGLSNPHVLAFEAHIVEDGYTFGGNTKYSLQFKLQEQQSASMVEEIKHRTLLKKVSSVTVDISNKGLFCIDMYPLTALIAVECPPKKHIRIVRTTTACSKGLFEPILLQNFIYSIDSQLYDPLFLGRKNLEQEDLNVTYDYDNWRCPILLYYDKPWLPDIELWDGVFLEYVTADFVLYEINGMHNYDYLLTELEANCISEAQNWTKLLQNSTVDPEKAWTKYNYVSCKEYRGKKSLPSVSSKYQVLNRNEKNRILFPQYNGFYVFRITVVDSLYSYCELSTVFSVYVHGAPPKSEVSAGKALISFLVLIFGTILMVYYFPKLLKENARMK